MGPNDYFMGKVDNWDALTFERAVMLETKKIPFTMKVGKRGAMIGIKAPEDLMSWGVAKIDRGVVRLASLLGCYELEVNGVLEGDVLNLVCMGEKGASMSSKILLSKDWTVSVGRKRELQLQAVKRSGNILEPVSACWAARGETGFSEGVEVFLPRLPTKVEKCPQGAEIECGDYKFVLVNADASRLALEGKVKWYVPNENGVFQKAN